jgi:L-rhamnose mutarotase
MRRIASVIGLPPENWERYEELHRDVWPGVLERLSQSHITNYSIYQHGDLLISFLEYTGEDYDADSAAIAADPTTQEWWVICDPLQVPLEGRAEGERWKELPELFHLD